MESDGAMQLITQSDIFKQANVEIGRFVVDNDNSTKHALEEASGKTFGS